MALYDAGRRGKAMQKVRELLRNEYIGAIAIGFVLAQAIIVTVSIVLRPIQFYLFDSGRHGSLFGGTEYPWATLLSSLISIVLYMLAGFLLFWWLYLGSQRATVAEDDNTAAADQFE